MLVLQLHWLLGNLSTQKHPPLTNLYYICLQGVESERCASFTAALAAGKPVYTETSSTDKPLLYLSTGSGVREMC